MAAEDRSDREHWLKHAAGVSRRINLAWWLEALSTPLVVIALIGAVVLLWFRRNSVDVTPAMLAAATGGALFFLIAICGLVARRRFETPDQALVRIEAAMRLDNRLTAASSGVATWPAPVSPVRDGLRWQWPRLLLPLAGALVLLAGGLWIPIRTAHARIAPPPEQPQSWKQLESELDHLAKEEIADESYLEQTRKQLDDLKSREQEQWFSHSSLEATDNLKKSHRSETERLERDLARTTRALDAFAKHSAATPEQQAAMRQELDQAIQGLQNGSLKPNPALLDQLKKVDPSDLGQLSAEQRQQLRENLQKHGSALQQLNSPGQGNDWSDELLAGQGEGEGGGGEEGGDGETGRGGISRGPGHDSQVLGKSTDPLETGELTGLTAKDLSQALPGDLLQLQRTEHEVDTSATRVGQGGDVQTTGSGGERIWRETLDPAEQRALKRYFE